MTNKWYVGPGDRTDDTPPYSKFENIVLFQSPSNPTFGSHGDRVRYCFGPYDTKHEAIKAARYHFPCIRRFVDLEGRGLKVYNYS